MSSKSKSPVGERSSRPSKVRTFRVGRNAVTGEFLSVSKASKSPATTIVEKVKIATSRKNDVIQIRASAETKAMLIRAASLRGQRLSEFMLDSARREAEDTILDQRAFFLEPDAHAAFLDMLDKPTQPSKDVRARMNRKLSWES